MAAGSWAEQLAREAGDVDRLVAIKARDLSSDVGYQQIVEVLVEAKRHEEALGWAQRGLAATAVHYQPWLRDFVASRYRAGARLEEAVELRAEQLRDTPSLQTYQALKDDADALGAWPEHREAALAQLRDAATPSRKVPRWGRQDRSTLVEIFLWEAEVGAAWEEAQAGGCSESLWRRLALARGQQVVDVGERGCCARWRRWRAGGLPWSRLGTRLTEYWVPVQQRPITVFQVLDNFLGESTSAGAVRDLSERQVVALCDALAAHYEAWEPPAFEMDEFVVFPSSFGAAHLGPGLRIERPSRAHQRIRAWMLYADRALARDPLDHVRRLERPARRHSSHWQRSSVSWRPGKGLPQYQTEVNTPRKARRFMAQTLDELVRYRPLIEAGALTLIPMLNDWRALERGCRPSEDNNYGYDWVLEGWDWPFYYDTAIRYAASLSVRFLPDDAQGASYLQYRMASADEELRRIADVELKILPALLDAEVPAFMELSPQTLAELRRDQGFAEWRVALRNTLRTVTELPGDDRFQANARGALEDMLAPVAATLRQRSSRMYRLHAATKGEMARLAFGAVYGGGLGALAGGSLLAAAAGAGASALTSATLKTLIPTQLNGSGAVLARIAQCDP